MKHTIHKTVGKGAKKRLQAARILMKYGPCTTNQIIGHMIDNRYRYVPTKQALANILNKTPHIFSKYEEGGRGIRFPTVWTVAPGFNYDELVMNASGKRWKAKKGDKDEA